MKMLSRRLLPSFGLILLHQVTGVDLWGRGALLLRFQGEVKPSGGLILLLQPLDSFMDPSPVLWQGDPNSIQVRVSNLLAYLQVVITIIHKGLSVLRELQGLQPLVDDVGTHDGRKARVGGEDEEEIATFDTPAPGSSSGAKGAGGSKIQAQGTSTEGRAVSRTPSPGERENEIPKLQQTLGIAGGAKRNPLAQSLFSSALRPGSFWPLGSGYFSGHLSSSPCLVPLPSSSISPISCCRGFSRLPGGLSSFFPPLATMEASV